MKKILLLLSVLASITCVYAVTIGVEPPVSYINSLKTCTAGTFSTKNNGLISEYKIKGKLPNGRCEVQMTDKYDWDDPQTEKDARAILGMFSNMATDMAGEKKLNDQQLDQVMKEVKQSKSEITTCRFSQQERNDLVKAYNLHDGKQDPGEVKRDANGNLISFKGSFSTDKMSSYDGLMMKYGNAICKTTENGKPDTSKVWACEYSDTTCYYSDLGNGGSSLSCTKENPNISTFKLMDKVREHVKAGYCEKVF